MTTGARFPWGDLWTLVRPYWVSDERWPALGLLAAIVGLNLGGVYLNVLFAEWNNLFYDALQKLDEKAYLYQLFRFTWIAALTIIDGVYALYLNQMLQIRWRRWLTEHFVARWLDHRAYYRLQLVGAATDNPDQRIAQDLSQFVQLTLTLGLGLLSAVVTLASFLSMLWVLSGPFTATVFGQKIGIPGYMVWAAIVYSVAGTWLINRVGRPLVGLNFNQQRFEADYRFSLVRLRENAEAVALYGGEAREHDLLNQRFAGIIGNWWALMRRQKALTWWSSGYSQLAIIFPFAVAAPRFFSTAIQLGGLMQIAQAFGQVQGALSFIVSSYTDIAEWRAVVDRLVTFDHAMRAARRANDACAINFQPAAAAALEVSGLDLLLPDGRKLADRVALTAKAGEAVLISGRSGGGKSTLFRALAGIWPFARGDVAFPAGAKIMFLPQKPYMPQGSFADALSYPQSAADTTDEVKRQALVDCGLDSFANRLEEVQNWGQVLSPGEMQRVAFARILLKRPDFVFLDESTSSVDGALERTLYAVLRRRLPSLAIVSIGHRPGIAEFHERRYDLLPGPEGATLRPVPTMESLAS